MPHNDPSQERKVPRKNDLSIELLGTSFSITAEEEPVYLEGILRNYRLAIGSIQESTGLRDPLKLAILTGFLLCEKIQQIQREASEQKPEDHEVKEAEQITLDMIARIDAILEAERGAP
ncbi:MAG: cell division protein ZapA [Spirochaetaceae bacterium]|jgi:cell division protein ZapA (FtsZ GTPase activity inhibitor)|nr:cell division protein ZapA [Spirochaetaceae bacterium]